MANSRYDNNKRHKLNDGRTVFRSRIYPDIPKSDTDIYIVTQTDDRLDTLANQFYKDVDLWWVITTANPGVVRRDSFNLKPGVEIRIPQDIESILENFEKLNE